MFIEHVALNVPEPAKVAQWYAQNLGMRIVRASDQSPYMHFVADEAGRGVIEFYCNPVAPVPDYPAMHPFTLHIAFAVEDMAAARARLLAAGATAVDEIVTTPAGDQLVFLRDPWGFTLQLAKRATPLVS
jgi:catechol 2,3-dioxygenase-like lactoylglutathione lyase family enzyme